MASTSIPSSATGGKKRAREIVLLITLVLLLLCTIFTAFVARIYHKRYRVLGDEWFAKGEENFRAGDAAGALGDYRNALLYSPANATFQFHLAKALAATGHNDEARAYLTTLLSDSSGSGEINLELARIAASSGPEMMLEALRYYHAAIYGVWGTDPIGMRWQIRKEFCEYLLNNNAINQAESEIMELADNTNPEDISGQKVAGDLLLRAHIWSRALQQFQTLLTHDPHDEDALAGAATAAFQLGQYAEADEYFNRLSREKASTPDLAKMRQISGDVVSLNPYARDLSTDERAKRAAAAVSIAQARANACIRRKVPTPWGNAPASPLETALQTSTRNTNAWSSRDLRKYPERIESAMSSVFELEDAAANRCGEPQGSDYALWLIGHSRSGSSR